MSKTDLTRRALFAGALTASATACLAVIATPAMGQDATSGMDHGAMMQATPAVTTPENAGYAGMEMAHQHLPLEVASYLPIPSVTHLVFPDAMDGFNIQILTKDFTFTPASINRDVVYNEGHAHLYVNGSKIARVYGNWYHLPASTLQSGVNLVTVTLNANDHSEWVNDGTPLASSVRVVRP